MAGRKGIPHTPSYRKICPNCGKKGVKKEEMIPTVVGVCCIRTCQYCQAQGKRWYRNGQFSEIEWS